MTRSEFSQAASVLDGLLTRERLMAWGADLGADLDDPAELHACVAVGLTTLLWRNTHLENIHTGVEWRENVEALANTLPLAEQEEFHKIRGSEEAAWHENLYNLGLISDVAQVDYLIDGREHGHAIPDSIMMRLNCSTAGDLRAILTAMDDPHAEASGAHQSDKPDFPLWLYETALAVANPDRELIIGKALMTAGQLIGPIGWELFEADLNAKVNRAIGIGRVIGSERLMLYVAVSALSYSNTNWPLPYWVDGIDILHGHVLAESLAAVYHDSREAALFPTAEDFWARVTYEPASLHSEEVAWLFKTRVHNYVRDGAMIRADRLGRLPTEERFNALIGLW